MIILGFFNRANNVNGCFNTEPEKIRLFNKPSELTLDDWCKSEAHQLLSLIPSTLIKDGVTINDLCYWWWMSLDSRQRQTIMSIPNFDKEIFKEITGISVEE